MRDGSRPAAARGPCTTCAASGRIAGLPRHGGVATRGSDVAEDSTHTGLTRMSDYEAKAWQAAINALERKSSRRRLPRRLRKVGSQAQELAATSWDRAPGTESMEQLFGRAIHGLRVLTFDPALNSVDVAKVERRYAAQHPDVGSLADVQLLDLRVCDTALPRVRARYAAMAAGRCSGHVGFHGAHHRPRRRALRLRRTRAGGGGLRPRCPVLGLRRYSGRQDPNPAVAVPAHPADDAPGHLDTAPRPPAGRRYREGLPRARLPARQDQACPSRARRRRGA